MKEWRSWPFWAEVLFRVMWGLSFGLFLGLILFGWFSGTW